MKLSFLLAATTLASVPFSVSMVIPARAASEYSNYLISRESNSALEVALTFTNYHHLQFLHFIPRLVREPALNYLTKRGLGER